MKLRIADHRYHALTIVEILVTITVIILLAALVLSFLAAAKKKNSKMGCINDLKQIGLAVRIWSGDNFDKLPQELSVTAGGAQEMNGATEAWKVFQVMSNELSTPKILRCPNDPVVTCYATNFSDDLKGRISYFASLNATLQNPQALLAGDANLLVNDQRVTAGSVVDLRTSSAGWSRERHNTGKYFGSGFGNVVFVDSSAQITKRIGFDATGGNGCFSTNRLTLP